MSSSDRKRLPPIDATTRELYLYSGNQCAFPECTELLLKENGTWNCQVAHIYGIRPDAARGHHDLTNEQLREPSNLVLMCPNHHNEIDNKDLGHVFTVREVKNLKEQHETRYRKALKGLERILDSTAGVVVKRPQNLCALEGFWTNMTDDEIRENTQLAAPFIDALAKQPQSLRDLVALILVHGEAKNDYGRREVKASVTKIAGIASSITQEDLKRRAESLRHDGLLSIEEEDNHDYFVLTDPTANNVGWDIFVGIHDLAAADKQIIKRVIDELDFTALDN